MLMYSYRDDLRTANIIADDLEGVSCLVIDRETFNQLISSLDEIRTRYRDELVERRRYKYNSLVKYTYLLNMKIRCSLHKYFTIDIIIIYALYIHFCTYKYCVSTLDIRMGE